MGKFKEEIVVEKINKKISFTDYKNGQYSKMDGNDSTSLYKTE